MTKTYLITRSGGRVAAWVVHGEDTDGYRLPHLMKHSPDGFEYGYGGSGPSDLARSIVGDALRSQHPPAKLYHQFKWEWVATLEGDGPFRITEEEVREIIGARVG